MITPYPNFGFPYFRRPYYYNYPNYIHNPNINLNKNAQNTYCPSVNKKNNQNNFDFSNNNKKSSNNSNLEDSSNDCFEIFGLKLHFDDLLLISILFFLYQEDVKDTYLYIALILLLIS